MAVTQYEDALRQVKSLSIEDKKRLLAELAEDLETSPEQTSSILSLRGLGKDIWRGLDAQTYVNQERASWNELREMDR